MLLVAVDIMGVIGMGAQRWIDLGPMRSSLEMMKVALVMALAAYYAGSTRRGCRGRSG